MSGFSEAIRTVLRAGTAGWPDGLPAKAWARVEGVLDVLPADVRDTLLAGFLDPDQELWAWGALQALVRLGEAGCTVQGMAHDELFELVDPQEVAFALAPLGVPRPPSMGSVEVAKELLGALDGIFAERGFVVHVVKPLPADLEVQAVARAVRLWLSELGPADSPAEGVGQRATYEDEGVRIDFTLTPKGTRGRQLTFGPLDVLERLHGIEKAVIDAVARHEQAVGDLPLVMVMASNRPWAMPRGYVQLQLYGTTSRVQATCGAAPIYQAWFPSRGSAMFHDRMFQNLASLWWLAPHATVEARRDPLSAALRAYDNPWARVRPELDIGGPCFRCEQVADDGTAQMRWQPG